MRSNLQARKRPHTPNIYSIRDPPQAVRAQNQRPTSSRHRTTKSFTQSSKQVQNGNRPRPEARPQSSYYRPSPNTREPVHRRNHSYTDKHKLSGRPQSAHTRTHSMNSVKSDWSHIQVAHQSHTGYSPGNPQKQNQDSFIQEIAFGHRGKSAFFSVCDGHGFYGDSVSQYIKSRLPELLGKDPLILTDPKKLLIKSIYQIQQELKYQSFDVQLSGSTMISILIQETKLLCANIGDSRALLGKLMHPPNSKSDQFKHWMAVSLSRDHKPDLTDEFSRIMQKGGRVESYKDEYGKPIGPARVWLRTENMPGLAMSRSIGDGVCKSVGVICEPEFAEYQLSPDDKFVVLGSDGVFEFLSNEEVVRIVVRYWKINDVRGAAEELARKARSKWLQEESVVDDITCIVVFLS